MADRLDGAIAARLAAPFSATDLEWKVQRAGVHTKGERKGEVWALIVPYIDARAAQRRLDDVFGMDGWEVTYREINLGTKTTYDRDAKQERTREVRGVIATLKFRLPDTERWVTREDGAEPTDVEAVKGGISSAFKRVVVTVGIGRYLYDTDPMFAQIVERGGQRGTAKYQDERGQWQKTFFNWEPDPSDVAKLTLVPSAPQALKVETKTTVKPRCPTCEWEMIDVRPGKRNPKAPDFRCKDRQCNGAIWPERQAVGA